MMSGRRQVAIWDKFLPPQPVNNEHYVGTPETYYPRLFRVITSASGIKLPTEDFSLELSDKVSIEEMASSPVGLRLLQMLVKITGARRVFEIGSYIGLSAMAMARAMPPDGRVITVEKFHEFAAVARRNFSINGFGDKITLLEGDAFEIIENLPKNQLFDIVFIDGNKERYAEYFQVLEPMVRAGGLAIIDDCLFHGDVLNELPNTEKGIGAKSFLELASQQEDWMRLMLPISNGIMLMIKPVA